MAEYALLVGVGSFENGLQPIPFVEEDVNGFHQVLLDTFCLPYENTEYLTNASATHERITSEVKAICQKAKEGDRVILYFATHGKTAYNTTFLSAYDASNNSHDEFKGWVRIETLLGLLHEAKCNVLAFLDCCHSTQFSFGRAIHDAIEPIKTNSCSSGEYTAVFAAAGENEEAYPVPALQHGCWTYYLLEALSGKAQRAFLGVSRRITINSLQSYLKENVSARVYAEYQKKQTPYIWGTFSDDEVIVELPEVEGEILKVKDIFFGEIDADSEKSSAPDTWEWILRLTTYTPRDIVSFFNCCKQFVGEEQRLTPANLWDATRPYSEYLWSEFCDVLSGTSLAEHEDALLQLFDRLVSKYNLQTNTRFDYSKFSEVFQETSGFEDVPISDALKILYETGIMCVHTKLGTYSFFRENPLRYDFNVWKESTFEIHVGLWKKFHIW